MFMLGKTNKIYEVPSMNFSCNHILRISDYSIDQSYSEKAYYEFICCFNVLHEICHSLCIEYSKKLIDEDNPALRLMKEELFANDFAVAFWRLYGEDVFFKRIFEYNNSIKKKVKLYDWNATTGKLYLVDILKYKEYYGKHAKIVGNIRKQLTFSGSFPDNHILDYSNFQSCSVVESFEKGIDLNRAIKSIGITTHKPFIGGEKLLYNCDINTPIKVISDVNKIFSKHDIIIPSIQYSIEKDPGYNCMDFNKITN